MQINEIPKCELNEIYRQGDGSSIIPLAHEIKEGKLPTDFQKNQKDRSFFASDIGHIEEYIGAKTWISCGVNPFAFAFVTICRME